MNVWGAAGGRLLQTALGAIGKLSQARGARAARNTPKPRHVCHTRPPNLLCGSWKWFKYQRLVVSCVGTVSGCQPQGLVVASVSMSSSTSGCPDTKPRHVLKHGNLLRKTTELVRRTTGGCLPDEKLVWWAARFSRTCLANNSFCPDLSVEPKA